MLRVLCVLLVAAGVESTPASGQALSLLDVSFISQSEALCGGAAAAMVLRYWGAPGLTAESFAGLVDSQAAGIRTDTLVSDLVARGWRADAGEGDPDVLERQLQAGHPVIALIEDRPGIYHYVVVVGWHVRGVVLHDPARAPYRVTTLAEFVRRWRSARNWMVVVTPREASLAVPPTPTPGVVIAAQADPLSCEGLIGRGIAEAQASQLEAAERTLTSAISCPGPAPIRELAGVRALQRRWMEVIELSSTVLRQNPEDAYARQLLATARFVTDDAQGALAAWNADGQPRIDLIQVAGLQRTRQRVVERLTSLEAGEVLTLDRFRRVARQLSDWPAITASALTYVPKSSGIADVRIGLSERSRLPRRPIDLGVIGGRALISRELRVPFGPLTTSGDRVELAWRFWPDRPRYSAGLLVPAPWGGLWGVQLSSERQPLTLPALETFRHDAAGLTLSTWQTGRLRWQAGGGIDRWADRGRFGTAQTTIDLTSLRDGVRLRGHVQAWLGRDGFTAADVLLRASRGLRGRRYVLDGRAALSGVSSDAPYDIWPAGDTGQTRATLLRAHPLIRGGRYRTSRLGATVWTASGEVQRIWSSHGAQFGPAIFLDLGRTARRVEGGSTSDADVGIGWRARLPGMPGIVRVDFGKGLRDGARALSFIYEP